MIDFTRVKFMCTSGTVLFLVVGFFSLTSIKYSTTSLIKTYGEGNRHPDLIEIIRSIVQLETMIFSYIVVIGKIGT